MDNNDSILLENFFNIKQYDNKYPNYSLLNNTLCVLLNSIEFTNTGLKISNNVNKTNLIQLTVNSMNIENSLVYISGMYNVSDGIKNEARCFTGNILWVNYGLEQETFLDLNITRFLQGYEETVDLKEHFKYIPYTECTHRDYNYLGYKSNCNEMVVLRKDDSEEFLEEQLKLIKKRVKCE